MTTLLIITLTATCLSCAFAVLLLTKSRHVPTDKPLAIVFAVLCLGAIDGLLTLTIPSWANNLTGISLPLFALCGPMLVAHVSAVSGRLPPARSIFGYISKPAWIYFAVCLAGFLIIYGLHALGIQSPFLSLIALLIALSISAWSVFYILKGIGLTRQHDLHLRRWFSRIDDKSLAWMRSVLSFPVAIIVIDFLLMFLGGHTEFQSLLRSLNLVSLCAVVIFFAYMAISHRAVLPAQEDPTSQEILQKTAYSNSGLTAERLERLLKKLDKMMEAEKPYLDPDVSLPKIARALDTTTNYLSQTLNQGRGLTFLDYINQHRIEEARQLIQTTSDNFLHIAFASGFNSRSTFNAAFRKHGKTTPSQFRRKILSEPIGSGDLSEANA